jgi:uncharacterized membrane protein
MSLVTGLVLLLAGVVWVLQGFDVAFAPQSFMTGDPTWVVLGVLAMIIGVVLMWRGTRKSD